MADFTTRVELYGSPSAGDYEKLHAATEKETGDSPSNFPPIPRRRDVE